MSRYTPSNNGCVISCMKFVQMTCVWVCLGTRDRRKERDGVGEGEEGRERERERERKRERQERTVVTEMEENQSFPDVWSFLYVAFQNSSIEKN